MITLQTNRLIIRDPMLSDIDDWHRLLADPQTMYYLPDIMTSSLAESQQNLENVVIEAQKKERVNYFFAIVEKATGSFVGSVGYTVTEVTTVGKLVGLGYFMLPEYQGKGYMSEAVREVIRFAFEENQVYRISTGCLAENKASERIMQKCGMIKEAEYKSYVWYDGKMKDRVEYRLLKEEWKRA